jgi:hypothetical protein
LISGFSHEVAENCTLLGYCERVLVITQESAALLVARVLYCEELQMPVRMLFISTQWDAKYPSVVQEDDVLLQY